MLFAEEDVDDDGPAGRGTDAAADRGCCEAVDEVVLVEMLTPDATLGMISTDACKGVTTSGNILVEDWLTLGWRWLEAVFVVDAPDVEEVDTLMDPPRGKEDDLG